jgi:7-carboxy-7-deazaguanine synthase
VSEPASSPARLKVSEIFYSLQGESTQVGRPCVLVRLTGCQMRCVWCDSAYAFHGGRWLTLPEVLAEVARHGCLLVELTGGEPLLQPAARPLLAALCDVGYEVMLETGGGVDIGGVDPRVRRVVDVKCPGSGEAGNNRWANLELLTPRDELKLVLASRADYEWARELVVRRGLAGRCPVHFAPVMALAARPELPGLDPAELAAWILADHLPVRLTLQLHKLLWGAETRGV